MYTCIYIHIYICMCMCKYMYICIYIYMYVYVYIYSYVYLYDFSFMYTYIHIFTCLYMYLYTHFHVYSYSAFSFTRSCAPRTRERMIVTGQKQGRVISVWTELTSHGEAQGWEGGLVFQIFGLPYIRRFCMEEICIPPYMWVCTTIITRASKTWGIMDFTNIANLTPRHTTKRERQQESICINLTQAVYKKHFFLQNKTVPSARCYALRSLDSTPA